MRLYINTNKDIITNTIKALEQKELKLQDQLERIKLEKILQLRIIDDKDITEIESQLLACAVLIDRLKRS